MHAQRFGYEGSGYEGSGIEDPLVEKPSFAHRFARQVAISFLRQPVQTSGLIVMGVASLTIMANALYFQPGMHPAPFFSQSAPQQIAAIAPIDKVAASAPVTQAKPIASVTPVLRPDLDDIIRRMATAPEIDARVKTKQKFDLSKPLGNKQTFEIQTLLARLGFFDKKRDGYYGPNTANAIRAFQKSKGLEQVGELSDVLKVQLYTAIEGGDIVPVKVEKVAKALPVPTLPLVKAPVSGPKPVLAPGPLELAAMLAKTVEQALPAMGENVASAVSQVAKAVGVEPTTRKVSTRKILSVPKRATMAPSQTMPVAVAAKPLPNLAKAAPIPAKVAPDSQPLVASIQRGLLSLGYLHGEADGIAGDETAAAIRQFENDNNFPITGQASSHMLTMLIATEADIS